MNENLEKLRHCFADSLQVDLIEITDSLNQKSIAKWDSLAMISLIVEIEAVFGVSFQVSELTELNSFSAAVEALKRKGVSF
ncbi:MAG TPA: acyl carrier protein [Pyrinomonadaceae bacterium]|nr:acyl carrier protein [Pyrinomonadaceae bacterium]